MTAPGRPFLRLDDPGDPALEDFRDLSDADARPDRRGIVIAEGISVVQRMIGSPLRMRAVIGVPSRLEALAPDLAAVDVPVYALDKWALSDVVGFRVTRGVLASADRPAAVDAAAVLAGARRVALLEGLNDFENLGALFRSAAAFGLDAVLLDGRCADPLYRRSVRVSMGHALRVPFAVLASDRRAQDGGAPAGIELLNRLGFATIAMTPAADAVDLRAIRNSRATRGRRAGRDEHPSPERWAVILGAEGPGLSDASMRAASVRARIPMAPGVDSLNVATAGAIAFALLS